MKRYSYNNKIGMYDDAGGDWCRIEELREAYEILSVNWIHTQINISEHPVRVCLSCNNIWDNHKENCISKKAVEWLDHHGKPEIKG